MLDSRSIFDPLWRATDADGDPIPGAKLKFYLAGTSSPLTVYSNSALSTSLGTTVTCDSAGCPTSDGSTKVSIWTGNDSFKLVITDADDATIATYDNLEPAIDSDDVGGGAGGAGSSISVEAGAGDYTVTSDDDGKILNRSSDFTIITVSSQTISHAGLSPQAVSVVDGAGGSADTITLPSAVTVGDGFQVGFRHAGTGEVLWIASDGANWVTTNGKSRFARSNMPFVAVADRLSAAPASPGPGAYYIVDGSPTGSWATLGFDEHDLLEADGNGGWIEHSPQDGWLAYVQDEDMLVQYRGSAWVDLDNITAPTATTVAMAIWEHQVANGTDGGTATSGSRQTRPINVEAYNTISGAALDTGTYIMTLPAGTYEIDAYAIFNQTASTQIYFKSTTTSKEIGGLIENLGTGAIVMTRLHGTLTLTAEEAFKLEYQVGTTKATNGLGSASSFTGSFDSGDEIFARVVVKSMVAVQGPIGSTGPQGAAGAGYAGTSTTSKAIANSGSQTITTQTGLAYTVGCRVKVSYTSDVSNFMEGAVTAYNSGSGSLTFTADYSEGSGTYAEWLVNLTGARGANGATGAAGPTSVDYTGDNGTSAADPGTGKVRVNNASMASATAIYINETDRHATSQTAWLATLDDSTSTIKGQLHIVDLTTTTQKWVFSVTGSITDNGTYDTVPVSYVSGPAVAMPTNNVALQFYRTGDAGSGSMGGTTGANDNRILRADGTGGSTIQSSEVTVDDNGSMTLPANVVLSGVLSPSSFSTAQNDYAPTDHATASVFRLTATAASSVTGLTAPSPEAGRVVTIVNVGSYVITLKDESASSAAANRFALDSDIQLAPDTSCVLIYDTTTDRWRALSRPATGKYSFFVDTGQMKNTTTGAKTGATLVANRDFGLTTNDSAGGSVLSFSATAKNHAWFKLAMPKSWDLGSLVARFFWTADTGTGTVEWEIAAASVGDGDALSFTFGTAATVTDAIGTLTNLHATAETSGFSASGSPAARDIVWFEVVRDGQAGNTDDTFSAAALLIGVEITINRSANTDD